MRFDGKRASAFSACELQRMLDEDAAHGETMLTMAQRRELARTLKLKRADHVRKIMQDMERCRCCAGGDDLSCRLWRRPPPGGVGPLLPLCGTLPKGKGRTGGRRMEEE